jgi:hypothetical protein
MMIQNNFYKILLLKGTFLCLCSQTNAASNTHFWNTQQKTTPTTSRYQEVSFDDYVTEQNSQVLRQKAKPVARSKPREVNFVYGVSNSTFNLLNENVQGSFSNIGLHYHQELQPNIGYGAGYKLFLPKNLKSIEFSIHQFQGTFYVNTPLQNNLNIRLDGGLAPRFVSAKSDENGKTDQLITHGIASAGLLYASNESVVFGFIPEMRLPILSEKVEKTSYDFNFVIGAQF